MLVDLRTARGACCDPSGTYRYLLWRTWHVEAARAIFILLNPSTADAERDDPTARRCGDFARRWGCGGLLIVNLFAYRATRPRDLQATADPVGPEADRYVRWAVEQADLAIAAWGNRGTWQGRDRAVLACLRGIPLYCLGCTQRGQPRHPLYLPRTAPLQRWEAFCPLPASGQAYGSDAGASGFGSGPPAGGSGGSDRPTPAPRS